MNREVHVCVRAALALTLWVFAGLYTNASSNPPVDIPARARGAAKIVVAQTTSVTPEWRRNSFGDTLIVSQFALDVQETLKGTPASVLFVDVDGGTLDGVTLGVSSLPVLKPGERGVFFLDATSFGSFKPHMQGLGILKLNANDQVEGSGLHLGDVRRLVQSAGR